MYSFPGIADDTLAIRDMALKFAREKLAPHAVEWDQTKHFPVDVLREAASLGMGAIYVREENGGAGLSRLDAVMIFEALATGCPSVAAYLSIHNMCAWMIDRFGNADQHAKYLPQLASMNKLASYCLTEPGAGSDAAALSTRAARDGSHYVLNGQKMFISGAGNADDFYVVMARTGGPGPKGISAIVVEGGTPGLSFGTNERKMGWNAQPTRAVMFENCRVPIANRLGHEGEGFSIAAAGLDGGRLSVSACSLGGAQAAIDKAVAYMGERRAFGKLIQEFQALQFRMADMVIELEAARGLLWRAARALDERTPDCIQLCAMAKRFVTDTGFEVANKAMQMLGGYGYLAEFGLEKLVRDLRAHQILEGTNDIMRLIVSRHIFKDAPRV